MESNNILAAPQIVGVDDIYTEWRRSHVGSRKDFYEFMTTHSPERDLFVAELNGMPEIYGTVAAMTIKAS